VKASTPQSVTRHALLIGTAISAVLAGCATQPAVDPALVQAHEAVDRLEADPLAQQTAGKPLQDAKDSLAAADDAARAHKPADQVDYLAYLAKRHADLGEAVVDENRARQQIARAQQQRDAVLLASREREIQAARDQAAAAQQELTQLQAKQTERGMILTLGSGFLFDTASDELKAGADESLGRVADFLRQHPGVDVRVEGHTDSVGGDSYNDALSERRASAVAHALVTRGVDASRVQAVGRGKELPIAGNDTAAGRQQNRRVEIIFSDMKGQFVSAR
jgi:outer membrane protein OmpA-like peptidoglycan-associated protein